MKIKDISLSSFDEASSLVATASLCFNIVECGAIASTTPDSIDDSSPIDDPGPLHTRGTTVLTVELSDGISNADRIRLHFYDEWARKFRFLERGCVVRLSGPIAVLVDTRARRRCDDHPCCIVVADDVLLEEIVLGRRGSTADVCVEVDPPEAATAAAPGGHNGFIPAANLAAAAAAAPPRGGSGGAASFPSVSVRGSQLATFVPPPVTLTKGAIQQARSERNGSSGGRGQTGGGGATGGRGGGSSGGGGRVSCTGTGRRMPSHYTYSALADLPGIIARQQQQQGQVQANRPVAVYLYGVVCSFGHRHQTAGDKLVSVNLIDETVPDPADSVNTNLFSSRWGDLPQVAMVGDILRFHRADLTVRATPFGPRPQLVARVQARSAWVLLRRRRLKAAVYQTGPEGGGSNGAAVLAGGGVGTAAAGGHATSFDPREWEVLHNHGSMTIEANDVERARRLSDWFLGALPTIRFNNPGASKTLSAVFAPPSPAAAAAAQENRLTQMDEYADVVGVLTGLEESTEGGQSAVSRFTVWDGTVPPVTLPTSEVDAAVDAAIRAAGHLPPPLMPRAVRPSLLNVRVAAHGVPLLDLGLRMGLWVRLRRLQVRKNLVTRTLDASVGFTTAVNLLPPTTAEVHACVLAYLAAATAPGTGAAGVVPLPISARIPANAGGAGAALPQTPVARTAPMTTLTLPRPLAATGLAVSGAGAAASQPFRCSIEEILGLPAPAECRCQVRAIKFFTMPGGQVIRKRKRGATGGAGGDSSGADGAGDGASDGTEHIMALRLEDETAAIDAIVCGETLVRVLLGGLSPDAVEVDTAAAAQAQERLRWLVSGAEPHPMELTVASSYRNLPGGGREKTYAVLGPIVPSAA